MIISQKTQPFMILPKMHCIFMFLMTNNILISQIYETPISWLYLFLPKKFRIWLNSFGLEGNGWQTSPERAGVYSEAISKEILTSKSPIYYFHLFYEKSIHLNKFCPSYEINSS